MYDTVYQQVCPEVLQNTFQPANRTKRDATVRVSQPRHFSLVAMKLMAPNTKPQILPTELELNDVFILIF